VTDWSKLFFLPTQRSYNNQNGFARSSFTFLRLHSLNFTPSSSPSAFAYVMAQRHRIRVHDPAATVAQAAHQAQAQRAPAQSAPAHQWNVHQHVRDTRLNGTQPGQPFELANVFMRFGQDVPSAISRVLGDFGALKYQLYLHCSFIRATTGERTDPPVVFPTTTVTPVRNVPDIRNSVPPCLRQLQLAVDQFVNNGSDWVLDNIDKLVVRCVQLNIAPAIRGSGLLAQHPSLRGSSYFKHPLDKRRAYCNIKNGDELCFKYAWCLHSSLQHVSASSLIECRSQVLRMM
jgi:hypothetical protein